MKKGGEGREGTEEGEGGEKERSMIREIHVAIPFRWDKFRVISDRIQSGAQRISRIASRQCVLGRVFAEST
jgi:hypothetical protein